MQVYYFTRTHRSEKIARELADRYGVTANKIDDGKSWNGFFGFLRAGMMSSMKKSLPAKYATPQEGETILLSFPLWASNMPPAVRTFVNEVGRDRIICLPTSGGGAFADPEGFIRVIDLPGKEISAPKNL
jgi:hypothetical protein